MVSLGVQPHGLVIITDAMVEPALQKQYSRGVRSDAIVKCQCAVVQNCLQGPHRNIDIYLYKHGYSPRPYHHSSYDFSNSRLNHQFSSIRCRCGQSDEKELG